ncbi:MAG: NUDIX hydrolase, partial [Clostridiales bacterium]|nr:NUDIX hydrolase [Clostridiales bacterium]
VEDTGKQNLTEGEKEAGYEAVWVPLDEAVDMFSKYEDFHQTAIEDYGLYKREYIALKEYAE